MTRSAHPLKPHELATLVELVRANAVHSYAKTTSSELGLNLGISQQAASKRLADLERDGLIERMHSGRGFSVRITASGMNSVRSFYNEVRGAFEAEKGEMKFTGTVFKGLGEGGYYVSIRGYSDHFESLLGFRPFPGTLNLRLSSLEQIERRRRLESLKGIEIPGFVDKSRTYGPVKCFKAEIGGKLKGAVLVIERTHYDSSVLEVISPVELRRALRLKDGDECEVIVRLD